MTSTSAADLQWSVRGVGQGKADGGPVNWTFEWDFLDDDGDIVWHDCTYVIQADAFDAQGRSGATRAVTVVLNRRQPLAPNNLDGGRNGNADFVDLLWTPIPNATSSATGCSAATRRVCSVHRSRATGRGPQPMSRTPAAWTTRRRLPGRSTTRSAAVDHLNASGALREGDDSTQITVDGTNTVPSVPQNLTSCVGGSPTASAPTANRRPPACS